MFTLPDKGEATDDVMSIFFQEYLDGIVEAANGYNMLLSGCAVTGNANMAPSVAKGAVNLKGRQSSSVTAATVTIPTADATHPRIDLIVMSSAGTKQVRQGTAAANPKPPVRSTDDTLIAAVYVPAGATSITNSNIIDLRMPRVNGPVLIHRNVTPVTVASSNAITTLVTVQIPDTMMTEGNFYRIVRVRCGGTYLANSGTGTMTFTIDYGNNVMWADVTGATTNDADRGAWRLDFDFIATGGSAQFVSGLLAIQTPGAKTVPSSGTAGDLSVATHIVTPILGRQTVSMAQTVDLRVRVTNSVSNANFITELEYSYAELI